MGIKELLVTYNLRLKPDNLNRDKFIAHFRNNNFEDGQIDVLSEFILFKSFTNFNG